MLFVLASLFFMTTFRLLDIFQNLVHGRVVFERLFVNSGKLYSHAFFLLFLFLFPLLLFP